MAIAAKGLISFTGMLQTPMLETPDRDPQLLGHLPDVLAGVQTEPDSLQLEILGELPVRLGATHEPLLRELLPAILRVHESWGRPPFRKTQIQADSTFALA